MNDVKKLLNTISEPRCVRSFIYLQFNPDSKAISGHITTMHSMVVFKLLTYQKGAEYNLFNMMI